VRPATGSDAVDAIIYAAHRIRITTGAALREHGLSLSSLKLLRALAEGDRSMREVSQALHVSPRTITDMIDGLEARGLVARCPHPSDRRVTRLHLTEAGTHELAGASTEAERVAATAVSALDQREQHTLRTLLARVCVPAAQPQDCPPPAGYLPVLSESDSSDSICSAMAMEAVAAGEGALRMAVTGPIR
jgi:DNA-binding MarR family transcriptional regulator